MNPNDFANIFLDEVKEQVASGEIQIKQKDEKGMTPLFYASLLTQDAEIVRFLLKSGSNVHERNNDGQTPLFFAVMNKGTECVEIVELLIEAGADIHAEDNNGMSPITFSCISFPAFKALMEAGANINQRSKIGTTPLLSYLKTGSEESNYDAMVHQLIKFGADVKAKCSHGLGAFHYLVGSYEKNQDNISREISLWGNNQHAIDSARLHNRMKGSFDFMKYGTIIHELKENGADINAKGESGATPLMLAALHDAPAGVIRDLVDAGADVHAVADNGATAAVFAIMNQNKEVLEVLVEAGANPEKEFSHFRFKQNKAKYGCCLVVVIIIAIIIFVAAQ